MTQTASAVAPVTTDPWPPSTAGRLPTVGPASQLESEYDTRLRAARGESDAWVLLVDRYVASVWSSALAQAADETEAAGLCELVWLRLADALPGLPDEPLALWLRSTVTQEAARLRPPTVAPAQRVPEGRTPAA